MWRGGPMRIRMGWRPRFSGLKSAGDTCGAAFHSAFDFGECGCAGVAGGCHGESAVGYSAADSPIDWLAGEESINEAGGKAVAAANAVEYVDFDLRHVNDLILVESDGSPRIAARCLCCAESAGNEFEIWVSGGHVAKHLLVSSDGKFGEIFGDAFELNTEHGGEVFFVSEEKVDFADKGAVDFLRFGFSADGAPKGVAKVEVVGNGSAVSAGGVHGFGRYVGG